MSDFDQLNPEAILLRVAEALMSFYRKRPVVVHAEQWWPEKSVEGVIPTWVDTPTGWETSCQHVSVGEYHVHTLEAVLAVQPGDWIITGIKGERYLCKPDIFEATYEPVTDLNDFDTCKCGDYRRDHRRS